MQEYHVDGFRFDLAKGFTQTYTTDENAWSQYDASRIAIWKDYNTYMKSIDPNLYVILEYFAVNQEEAELVSQGMMMWNNLSGPAEQCTMGYATNPSWDISGLFYDRYGFNSSTGNITYFESHDEERLQYKNEQYGNISGSYNVKDLATGLKRDEAAAVILLSSPGPKMLWQFGELGYDIGINTNGRTGEKPIHWEYLQDVNRRHLHDIYARMIKWKINNAVFNTSTFNYSLTGPVKTVQLTDPSNNLEVVANFDVVTQSQNVNFASTGTWYDNLTGTSINVTSVPFTMSFAPGEYHVYSTKPLN
jgi:1,4-alpha-glucan branching enzyme